ncbi:pitrilysin family protein [Pseudovibrio exalbescens]|uniref:M16 family metallopeptidase n=1 Tax=Pseudovibrio exalbescens TaxID=197461 RepID=UPI002366A69B|nr:pitrilysin family protein [Pseudovibrio exalbescens]MDD7911290.1 pitrilysin family protein [Pseudovibrio exalbescens]
MTVKTTRLDNGLIVLTDDMPHLKTAALGVWVKTGSRSEDAAENGITHLLEHMAFKGTQTRSALDIAEQVEAVGGEVNASTSVEHTNYYLRMLAEDVPLGVDILSDILQHSVLDLEELTREKQVILQEIGAAMDTPEDQAFDLLLETAWPDQSLGRPILGTPETVTSFTPEAIRAYMDKHYTASNMVLSAAGRVDHDEFVAIAQEKFGDLTASEATAPVASKYVGGEASVERDLQEVQIILGFEGCSYQDKDYYAVQILASVLGGGMSSRLFQEIREKRGLCYSIYSFHWAFDDSGMFAIHSATSAEHTAKLMDVLIQELNAAVANIEDKEIDRAKAQTRAGLMMALESPAARASQIARQTLIFGETIDAEELRRRVDAVTREDVCRVAQRVFYGKQPTLVHVGPKSEMPTLAQISQRLNEAGVVS